MRVASFCLSTSSAPSSYPGANSTSTNCSAIRSASSTDTGRFRTTTPPYADTGSEPTARGYASSIAPATATPQGFACLTITQAGSVNSSDSCLAADRSFRLLYESSRPFSCSTRESRWRRAPASA